MASNFSANQFEKEFKAKSLCNWEVPHWYPDHPRQRKVTTKFIANDRGHLLPNIERPKSSPWGRFLTTWQLPPVITKEMANVINAPPVGSSRWSKPDPERKFVKHVKIEVKKEKEDPPKIEPTGTQPVVKEEPPKTDEIIEPPKMVFTEKEKLNSPIAIARQGRRSIRHETLERDGDEH